MADVSKIPLVRFSTVPWKAALAVICVSFLGATIASTVIGNLFLPGIGKSGAKTAAAGEGFNVPSPGASLNSAAIDIILKRNIFSSDGAATDESATPTDAQGPKTTEAVKSDLPVKLVGTIYGGDPYSGIALVENNAKKTINSFMVGDTLLKDVVVNEVHKERIIVDHAGRLEYIEVVREKLSRTKRQKKVIAVSSDDQIKPIATEPPPAAFKEDGFERKERDISMTQTYRNKLLTTDITKVLQDAKATPNMINGELQGFILTRIRKDSIYEHAGLQNDDIVTEVNGVPLTDTAQAIRLLQSLRNESEIEIRITRGGAPQKFTLNVR